MISIVCVYSSKKTLNDILLKGLENQTVKFELIPVDNTRNRFKSAAEALNYGGGKAKGKYIMFVHQDVELPSDSWLENVEKYLEEVSDLGIAGPAGMSVEGRNHKERRRFGVLPPGVNLGQKPEEVQTLDEAMLIIPNPVFRKIKFDEATFDGWHCYGADYCLCIRQLGLKSYRIPARVYHRSLQRNMENLLMYQKKLYDKHKKRHRVIYATTGEISWLRLRLYSIIEVISPLYKRLFPDGNNHVKKALADCDRVLDLGCGHNSPLQYFNIPFSVGVELSYPYLQESMRRGIHSQYFQADIRSIEFKPKSFDAVVAVEVLEHLTVQEGAELLYKMEQWASKKVVVTTLNGYLEQDTYENNRLQEHKSGWSVKELRELEFKVFGLQGWKRLRGYKAMLKYEPAPFYEPSLFWGIISALTQKVTYYYPKLALQLLAIKRIGHSD